MAKAVKEKKKLNVDRVRPQGDRIVVRPRPAEQVSTGGIIIPDTAKEKPNIGTVVRIGRGKYENGIQIPMEAKVGDEIIYGKWAGTPIDVDGEELLIMTESSDVLAFI